MTVTNESTLVVYGVAFVIQMLLVLITRIAVKKPPMRDYLTTIWRAIWWGVCAFWNVLIYTTYPEAEYSWLFLTVGIFFTCIGCMVYFRGADKYRSQRSTLKHF